MKPSLWRVLFLQVVIYSKAMDFNLFSTIGFYAGCVLGSVGLFSGKWYRKDFENIVLIFFLSLLIVLLVFGWASYSDFEIPKLIQVGIFVGAFSFLLAFAKVFRERVLLRINELTIVGLNVLLGCLLFVLQSGSFIWLVFLIPTYISFLVALFPVYLSPRVRVGLYCWYLTMLLLLTVFLAGQQAILPFVNYKVGYPVLSYFISGTIFAYAVIHFTYLFRLFPYKREAESEIYFNERLIEHFNSLSNKFSPDQYHFLSVLFVVALVCFVFFFCLAMGVFSLSSTVALIFLIISIVQTLFNKFFKTKSEYKNGLLEVMKSEHENVFPAKVVVFAPIVLVSIVLLVFTVFWPNKAYEEARTLFYWLIYG